MATIPFDTLKMVDRLVEAGVPAPQAKVQTELLAEAISAEDFSITERFSNKHEVTQELLSIDIKLDKFESRTQIALDKLDSKIDKGIAELDSKIKVLDSKLDKSMAELKSELIRWVVSVGMLQFGLIAGLLLKLVH
jgi:hypothetical protein